MTTSHLAEPHGQPVPPWSDVPDDGEVQGAQESTISLLEALFTQAPVGFAFHDTSGRYVRVNDVMARLNGRPASEHIGRTMPELLGDIGHEMERLLHRVLSTGEPVANLEVSFATGGPERPQTWMVSWYPAVDPSGGLLGVAFVATDVTELKDAESELARSEARYRSLVEATALDVLHANADGAIDVDMPRWRAITGQRRAEIAGFGWLDAVHPDDRDRVSRTWRDAMDLRKVFEAEFRIVAADGSERVVIARALPIVDAGDLVEWVGTSRDVTEAKQAESTRAALTQRAQTAAERTERLQQATSDLSRAVTVDDVITVVLDAGARALGATGRGVAMVDETRDVLVFRELVGYSPDSVARWTEIGLGAVNPAAESVRGGRPLFLSGRAELTGRWPVPEIAEWVEETAEHAWAVMPLSTTDIPFGVLRFGFDEERSFSAEDRVYLVALADQCAQALERATLFERVLAEAQANRRAEELSRAAETTSREAVRRLDVLARATAAVGAEPEPERALRALTEVVVAEFADSCAVYMVEAGQVSAGGDLPGAGSNPVLRRVVASVRPGLTGVAMPRARIGQWPADSPVAIAASTGRGHVASLEGAGWLSSPEIERWLRHIGAHTLAAVPLIQRGRVAAVVSLTAAGDRPPFTDADIAFLEELAAHATIAVEHAELHRRGRDTSLSLQRKLLPEGTIQPDGLEVAARYVPGVAETEVGGDWFDVLDLGAGRVGLVIGDVMGRGVHAAAIMGQLRTAIRTCARMDMSPSEILSLLDGLVADIDDGQIATCIYAVVEPHSGLLTLASAGHPPPLVAAPDGLVSRLYMQVGTPLGLLRGDAKEYTVRLGHGSTLALFTDGLVDSRDRDIDAGVGDLAAVLSRAEGPLDGQADEVLTALGRGDGHDDDVALLFVRLLAAGDPAVAPVPIDLPGGAAGLSDARARFAGLLEGWDVDPVTSDSAVLVLSELVTNALVHGLQPVSVRVRRTAGRVIVEVADLGQRNPHLVHAGADDESGRGLDLVSKVATRWGSRVNATGKVVWAELALPPGARRMPGRSPVPVGSPFASRPG